MRLLLLLLLLVVSSTASAVIIRHDVDDSRYRVSGSEFPALADLPDEGHGILIAPQWVVTVAHAVTDSTDQITINGVQREVDRVFIHPGYGRLPQSLVEEALASGDASKAMAFQAANHDIALMKLAEPVTDVEPATLYEGNDEPGKVAKLMGKGATGTGVEGQIPDGPHRTTLRRAFNSITSADSLWIGYVFDTGSAALDLEGMGGGGDSGGPVLIDVDGQWQLAGLTSWKLVEGNAAEFHTGLYGQTSYNVRLSAYTAWINATMNGAR